MAPPPSHSHRIAAIDALRGIAIFGILFSIVDGFNGVGVDAYLDSPLNLFWWRFHEAFISQRCIAIFSFLFGLGLFLQWQRASHAGRPFAAQHLRRMACLVGFGLINTTLFFSAEILLVYAVFGVLLLVLHRVDLRVHLGLAAFVFLLWGPFQDKVIMAPIMHPEMAAFEQAYPEERITAIFRSGGLAESARLRWIEYGHIFYFNSAWMRTSLCMVLLGYAAGRSGLAMRLFSQPGQFRLAGTAIAIPGGLFMLAGLAGFPTYADIWAGTGLYLIVSLGVLLSTFTLIWLFALLCTTSAGERVLKILAPIGRQSLTTYMGGAAVFAFIFHHYGFGLFRTVEPPTPFHIAIGTYVALGVFAHLWQRRFSQGPLEWVWRTLTYRPAPPKPSARSNPDDHVTPADAPR